MLLDNKMALKMKGVFGDMNRFRWGRIGAFPPRRVSSFAALVGMVHVNQFPANGALSRGGILWGVAESPRFIQKEQES